MDDIDPPGVGSGVSDAELARDMGIFLLKSLLFLCAGAAIVLITFLGDLLEPNSVHVSIILVKTAIAFFLAGTCFVLLSGLITYGLVHAKGYWSKVDDMEWITLFLVQFMPGLAAFICLSPAQYLRYPQSAHKPSWLRSASGAAIKRSDETAAVFASRMTGFGLQDRPFATDDLRDCAGAGGSFTTQRQARSDEATGWRGREAHYAASSRFSGGNQAVTGT